jgi:hypothetical protein
VRGKPILCVSKVCDIFVNLDTIKSSILHNFRLTHVILLLGIDLKFWFLLKITTWFLDFLLTKHDDYC